MKIARMALPLLLILAAPICGLADPAYYTYVGNPFTTYYPSGSFLAGNLTVVLELAAPVPSSGELFAGSLYQYPGLQLIGGDPVLNWSVTDGTITVQQSSAGTIKPELITDANGNIVGWTINVGDEMVPLDFPSGTVPLGSSHLETTFGISGYPANVEFSQYLNYNAWMPYESGYSYTPGTWTYDGSSPAGSVIPEPGSLALFGSGFLVLIWLGSEKLKGRLMSV